MYCSACGVAVTPGLAFCNYCGAKLNRDEGDKLPAIRPESLIFGMLAVFVFGMVAITVMMGVMKSVLELDVRQILGFALLPFLIMLLLEGVFIRLLFRRASGAPIAGDKDTMKGQTTKDLNASRARVLPEPTTSVTDHTTRAFDPIYTERK